MKEKMQIRQLNHTKKQPGRDQQKRLFKKGRNGFQLSTYLNLGECGRHEMRKANRKEKAGKERVNAFNFTPPGNGISEMMAKCCAGPGGFPECAAFMKGIVEQMKKQDSPPDDDAAEFQGRKK